jgi:hypothetical protein
VKIKLWAWEYNFDKEDAKIVVPIVLLLLGLAFTQLKKDWLLLGAVTYYLLYFFLPPFLRGLQQFFGRQFGQLRSWIVFRCPYCKSRELILQGYQEFHSDEFYAYRICNRCKKTSVLVNEKLLKANPD